MGALGERLVEAGMTQAEVAAARTLLHLTRSGVTPSRLRRSLGQLGGWLDDDAAQVRADVPRVKMLLNAAVVEVAP